jgi:CDP-paratose 2-epimerase
MTSLDQGVRAARSYSGVLITGGAGFVGSSLALALKADAPKCRVVAFDNLRRRGSELNVGRLRAAGVEFVHGDVRVPDDLAGISENCGLLIECSAEPSVLAGYGESPAYVLQTNLVGTINCLEWARRHRADVVFLSTSRVYPTAPQNALALVEAETRFELSDQQPYPGVSSRGISEQFPLDGSRSLYGATKLASELLVEEYRAMYGLRTIVNRCSVLTGPWQMGKVEQGVFSLWMLSHVFEKPLRYVGFGGQGKQVRDFLHVRDLYRLLLIELGELEKLSGSVFNAGGGRMVSLSLQEATELCRKITGKRIPIESVVENRVADLPVYLTDNTRVRAATGWQAEETAEKTLTDIYTWVRENEQALRNALG